MTSTISHGSPGSGPAIPPLRREVLVDADRRPRLRGLHRAHRGVVAARRPQRVRRGATVAFVEPGVGARIVESKDGAADSVWGTVTRWEPGVLIAFTWHPGYGPDAASKVTVTFEETDGKTLVTLEHTGWESFGERAAEARDNYSKGWTVVLGAYAAGFPAA